MDLVLDTPDETPPNQQQQLQPQTQTQPQPPTTETDTSAAVKTESPNTFVPNSIFFLPSLHLFANSFFLKAHKYTLPSAKMIESIAVDCKNIFESLQPPKNDISLFSFF